MTAGRVTLLRTAALRGAGAGLVGVAAMTAGEKLEQLVTSRSNSYVPARALLTLLGKKPSDEKPEAWNHTMRWGTGALLRGLRGVWAATGIRGQEANVAHTAVRLAVDQTV